jgi:hypothetical protein
LYNIGSSYPYDSYENEGHGNLFVYYNNINNNLNNNINLKSISNNVYADGKAREHCTLNLLLWLKMVFLKSFYCFLLMPLVAGFEPTNQGLQVYCNGTYKARLLLNSKLVCFMVNTLACFEKGFFVRNENFIFLLFFSMPVMAVFEPYNKESLTKREGSIQLTSLF